MKQADAIRSHAREKYVAAARAQRKKRFSIRTGDVVREMRLPWRSTPAVCSALKTREFIEQNALRLVNTKGPRSGQTTTVTYEYEFADQRRGGELLDRQDAWNRLQGALKDIFAELGGGENYLRKEREEFHGTGDHR
jgi:hypothetical protein